jgi:hypothetical protein
MSYNSQQKLRDNIDAIAIALEFKHGMVATKEQAVVLSKYAGFGGLKAVLYPYESKEGWIKLGASKQDLSLRPQIMELHQLLQENLPEPE